MPHTESFQVCYLLLIPYHTLRQKLTLATLDTPKDAPYFYDFDMEIMSGEKEMTIMEQTEVTTRLQLIDQNVWLIEAMYTLTDPLSEASSKTRQLIQTAIKRQFIYSSGKKKPIFEEYTIVLVQEDKMTPTKFVSQYAHGLANLIKTVDKPLDTHDVDTTLETRVRYSDKDLTIIDWNGAILITDDGDFPSDINLLKIGNYQLLRYRMLDDVLDTNLAYLQETMLSRRLFLPQKNKVLNDIVRQRLSLLLNFEKVNQSLLLIGDWYSAQMYRAIVSEFYINDWKTIVANKLDSLGSIHDIVTQNLSFSWSRFLDFVQISGWLLLLIGYFVLFFIDANKGH